MSASVHLLDRARDLAGRTLRGGGGCTPALHEQLAQEGFHDMLAADGDGGLQMREFAAVLAELARGDAAAAWCAASLAIAGRCAADLGAPAGARCALLAGGGATAVAGPASGGWVLSGSFRRCAAARVATHFLGEATTADGGSVRFLAPAAEVRLEGAGTACAATVSFAAVTLDGEHASGGGGGGEAPSRARAVLAPVALASVFAGAAARAAELHAELLEASASATADPDQLRWMGASIGRAAAAQTLLEESLERSDGGGADEGPQLGALAHRALGYAWTAASESARTAPTGDGEAGARSVAELQAIARTLLELRGDPAPLGEEELARALARERLGLAEA